MVNHKKIIRSVFFVLHFHVIIIIYTGCLEQFIGICNTSEKSEGCCNVYYSAQCSCNWISLIDMYEDGEKYRFTFDDSYAQEADKLRIGFKNTKGETLDGVFLTWGSQKMPPREVKNGDLLTSIKKTLFTCKNKGVYSMCLKRNDDYDCNDIDEVIITIYIENESNCKASFIIDDKGVNVYNNKCSQGSSKLVDPKNIGETNSKINNIKKESNSQIKNCEQIQENQNKELEVEHSFQFSDDDKRIESIMADERILKIFENDESIEPRNQREECEGRLKHLKITNDTKENGNKERNEENENVEKKNNKENFLEKVKDKITYSNKKVSVSDDLDSTSLAMFKSIVGSLQIYFETELGEVIKEPIFKSWKGSVLSGAFISDIKKTFLKKKKENSFSMSPINMGGTRKCRIKILHKGTGDFFYLINADNKEHPDIFFY